MSISESVNMHEATHVDVLNTKVITPREAVAIKVICFVISSEQS